jgi:hypothetical protein
MAETQLSTASASHPERSVPLLSCFGASPVAALRDYVNRLGYEVLAVGTRGEANTLAVLGSVELRSLAAPASRSSRWTTRRCEPAHRCLRLHTHGGRGEGPLCSAIVGSGS